MLSMLLYISILAGSFKKIDLQDTVLLSPLKIQNFENQLFLLDWRIPGIVLLEDGKYKSQFGQNGKGPSDFHFLKSFSVSADGIFVLNDILAEIKTFNLDGTFEALLLTDMDQNKAAHANDILATGSHIFISFNKASIPLKKFDSKGIQLKEWPVPIADYPVNIGHPIQLFESKDGIFLFNQFDGSLFWLDPGTDVIRQVDAVKIPGFGLRLEQAKTRALERQKNNKIQLVSTRNFLPIMASADILKAIESRPINKEGHIHRAYDFNSKEVSQVDFSGLPSKPVCLKAIAGQTFVIDYDGDLYVKNAAL